jgi:hypothetical protein
MCKRTRRELGQIEKDFPGNDQARVVHVNEAFGNRIGEANAGKILLALVQQGGAKLVCVEAMSEVSTEPLRTSWQALRSSTPDPLAALEAGWLRPLDYGGLFAGERFEVCGVEDRQCYQGCIQLVMPLADGRKEWATASVGCVRSFVPLRR